MKSCQPDFIVLGKDQQESNAISHTAAASSRKTICLLGFHSALLALLCWGDHCSNGASSVHPSVQPNFGKSSTVSQNLTTWLGWPTGRKGTWQKTWEILALGAVFLAALEPLEPPCEKSDGIGLLEHEPMWREDSCPGSPQTRLLATRQPAWLNFYHLIGVLLIPDNIGQSSSYWPTWIMSWTNGGLF